MKYFLGIDGGGTKTSCVVGDNTSVLGSGIAGGCNIVRLGAEVARTNLQSAIMRACEAANLSADRISHVCIGTAGISATEVHNAIRQSIAELVPGNIEVVGDHDIAFAAAFGDAPGVIVASGTGSIACGRNGNGETARAGGHGFAISDEGSGHWIGRTAVTKTLAARDSGDDTRLEDLIVETLKIVPLGLVSAANAIPPPDFASLFPAVLRAADEGDKLALAVLEQAGNELAGLARVVINRLWTKNEAVRVSMVGGVFSNSSIVCAQFANRLRTLCPTAVVLPDVADPILGALSLARKSAALLTT